MQPPNIWPVIQALNVKIPRYPAESPVPTTFYVVLLDNLSPHFSQASQAIILISLTD